MITIFPKGILAFDYDGTLVEPTAHERFRDYLESIGVACDKDVLQSTGDYCLATGLSAYYADRHYVDYLGVALYRAPKAMPGAITATEKLRGSFNLHIVTSRATEVKSITVRELQSSFPDMFTTFNFGAGQTKKAEIVESLSAILYIDDAPEHAARVADVAFVILMPGPGQNSTPLDSRLILLEAHQLVQDGMSDKDWQKVWLKSWQEIPYLIRDLFAKQNRTQILVL